MHRAYVLGYEAGCGHASVVKTDICELQCAGNGDETWFGAACTFKIDEKLVSFVTASLHKMNDSPGIILHPGEQKVETHPGAIRQDGNTS
jgi:hypothetical protein